MKICKLFVCLLIIILPSHDAFCQNEMTKLDFKCRNGYLDFYLYSPQTDTIKDHPKPLVIVLHGCSQSASSLSIQSGWNMLAERYNFYVLYPQQKLFKNPSNCFNWYISKNIQKDSGELYCIKQAIDFVKSICFIDSNMIFSYGLSAGAVMSMALISCYPEIIKAGACLAGLPYFYSDSLKSKFSGYQNLKNYSTQELESFVYSQNPDYKGKYPKLIIVHGKKDVVVPIKNGYSILRQWKSIHHIVEVDVEETVDFMNCKGLIKKTYFDANKEAKIVFYEMENLGHAILVDPGKGEEQGGETGVFSIDKDFFSTYWIARDFGLIK